MLSRPLHGNETIDVAVIEQLIAPLLKAYQVDGTSAFDQYGGAAVKRLLAPDEVLILCVDVSTSMGSDTDFTGVNDTDGSIGASDARALVEPEFYNQGIMDEATELLCDYEGSDDMVAVVAFYDHTRRRCAASKVVETMQTMLLSDITHMSKDMGRIRDHASPDEKATELKKLKVLWAASKTHEEVVIDFLIYRATVASPEISQRWTWSAGVEQPTVRASQRIPGLGSDILHLPHNLRCPISHTLMTDAVTTADGHTYSSAAITEWFEIRKSSPLTGLLLQSVNLKANQEVRDSVQLWMDGHDLNPPRYLEPEELEVTFGSRVGSFQRGSCLQLHSRTSINWHSVD
ncbi:hypothetical protein PG994_004344 [Apiospora phragmitis]|uniref:peptidylprolyl isomerase n=1 Tax=Apiospora phragmitis TaxID=2905665 RepID=A0ABR1VTF7_9PEZI